MGETPAPNCGNCDQQSLHPIYVYSIYTLYTVYMRSIHTVYTQCTYFLCTLTSHALSRFYNIQIHKYYYYCFPPTQHTPTTWGEGELIFQHAYYILSSLASVCALRCKCSVPNPLNLYRSLGLAVKY